jgi:hypothetical protein
MNFEFNFLTNLFEDKSIARIFYNRVELPAQKKTTINLGQREYYTIRHVSYVTYKMKKT